MWVQDRLRGDRTRHGGGGGGGGKRTRPFENGLLVALRTQSHHLLESRVGHKVIEIYYLRGASFNTHGVKECI